MQTADRLPRIAAVVAFVIAGLVVLAGMLESIVVLPAALIPLCAGVGILRRRVWAAYGYATVLFAQLLLVPVMLARPGMSIGRVPHIIGRFILVLGLGLLYSFAGRSLAASGASPGRAWPWIVVAGLCVVPFFFVQNFDIPSGAMENTLLPGDSIVVRVFPHGTPARGQIIIFISPADRGLILIKRVIGVPGDRLRIADKVVILNGTALDEKYARHMAVNAETFLENFPADVDFPGCAEGREMVRQDVVGGEIVVPAGEYFVLGDNRENSLDSRCWGFVRASDVLGKPLMIYESIEPRQDQEYDPSKVWMGHRRWGRLFKGL